MKLKYYLRGLAIGIICTAIIMGIALSGGKKEKLTDAEIIERARILGMVMEEEADSQEEQEEKENQEGTKDSQEGGQTDKKDLQDKTGQTDKTSQTDNSPSEQENQANKNSQESKDGQKDDTKQNDKTEMKTVEIAAGDYSDVVSQKLFEAGLIPDAAAFNTYLTQSGKDQNLMVGVHQIPMGATQEEIIQILGQKPE